MHLFGGSLLNSRRGLSGCGLSGRGRRFNALSSQSAVDDLPERSLRHSAVDALAIDKKSRSSFHLQRLRLFHRGANLGLVLGGEAGIELILIEFGQCGFLAGDAVERVDALGQVAVCATDLDRKSTRLNSS